MADNQSRDLNTSSDWLFTCVLHSFTKGLSVDKIDLDILNGRGYLDNLELDERFMTAVLELPEWMNFSKILCSKIRLQVSCVQNLEPHYHDLTTNIVCYL